MGKNKHKWARPNFDKLFYGVGAVGLSGILYALYFISTCVSMAVDAGWSAVCVVACVFVTFLVGTVIQVAARRWGMGVRYAAGIGYGVSNGSACMIFLVCYGTGLSWPLYLGTQLLLAAPPVRLMLGFDDRILRLISGPSSKSQLLLPAPQASLGIAIGKELVIWTGLSLVASAGFSSTPNAVFTLLLVVVCAFLVADWNPTLMACALLGAALFFGAQLTGFGWAGAMGPIFSYARSAVGWLLFFRWWFILSIEGIYRFVIVDVHFPVTRLFYLAEDGNPLSWKSLVARIHRGFDLEPRLFLRPLVLLTCVKYFRSYLLDPVRISIKESREKAFKNAQRGLISGIYGLLFHAQLDLPVLERNFLFWDLKHEYLQCTMTTPLKDFMIPLLTSLLVARALLGQAGGFIWERPDLREFKPLSDATFKVLKDKDLTLSPTKQRVLSPLVHRRSLGRRSLRYSLTRYLEARVFRPSVTVQKSYPSHHLISTFLGISRL